MPYCIMEIEVAKIICCLVFPQLLFSFVLKTPEWNEIYFFWPIILKYRRANQKYVAVGGTKWLNC